MSPAARNILSHLRVLVSLREIIIFFNPTDKSRGASLLALFSLLAQRANVVNQRFFNIARKARYKPFGPHTFCWRKTTDSPLKVCCRSEAEASVPGATGEGRKPAGRCKNLFVIHIDLDGLDHEHSRMTRASPQGFYERRVVNHERLENHERRERHYSTTDAPDRH